MKSKRKYEILPWLFIATITGLLAYSNIKDSLEPIEHFAHLQGKVTSIGTCKSRSTVLIKGFSHGVDSKVICLSIDRNNNFQIFKTNREYDSILQNIDTGDEIEIRFVSDTSEEDKRYFIVELKKGDKTVYSYNQWKAQMNFENILLITTSLTFLIFGTARHRMYLRSSKRLT